MAVVIKTSDKKELISPKNKKFDVSELIGVIGHNIEYIQRYNKYVLIFNPKAEELGFRTNFAATNFIGYSKIIFGDVIIADYKEVY
jgi:hypothetical protein